MELLAASTAKTTFGLHCGKQSASCQQLSFTGKAEQAPQELEDISSKRTAAVWTPSTVKTVLLQLQAVPRKGSGSACTKPLLWSILVMSVLGIKGKACKVIASHVLFLKILVEFLIFTPLFLTSYPFFAFLCLVPSYLLEAFIVLRNFPQ